MPQRWRIAPYGPVRATRGRYRGNTPVRETDFDTAEGSIRLVDFVRPRGKAFVVVRLVEGVRGRVRLLMDISVPDDDGRALPWRRHVDGAHVVTAGVDSVWLRTPVGLRGEGCGLQADFFVTAGELVPFVMTRQSAQEAAPAAVDPFRALAETESYWSVEHGCCCRRLRTAARVEAAECDRTP
jgi:hypothetical protein